MIFRHRRFSLDSDLRFVNDENGKELRITGNAYRVLVFLCERRHATLTEIGDYLDHAKEFDENHLRQYRYRINSIVGHDVITYRNGIYSVDGGVSKVDKSEEIDRNTVLLQSNQVLSGHDSIIRKKVRVSIVPAIIAAAVLLMSFLSMPSAFYTILRIVVTGVAVYYVYVSYKSTPARDVWFWLLLVTAVVFNPLLPIYLHNKSYWQVIDISAALIIGVAGYRFLRFSKPQ